MQEWNVNDLSEDKRKIWRGTSHSFRPRESEKDEMFEKKKKTMSLTTPLPIPTGWYPVKLCK